MVDIFDVEPGEEWPATEPWVKGGKLGEQYYNELERARYTPWEAARLALQTLEVADSQQQWLHLRYLVENNRYMRTQVFRDEARAAS